LYLSQYFLFIKFGDFTSCRRFLNPVFQLERVTFSHFRTGTGQFNRPAGSGIPGASACVVRCQPVFQVIGYTAIQRFVGTPDQINNPFPVYLLCLNNSPSPFIHIRNTNRYNLLINLIYL